MSQTFVRNLDWTNSPPLYTGRVQFQFWACQAMWLRYSQRIMAKRFANRGDLDQTTHSAASDLGLCCLPITLLVVSRLKWVNIESSLIFFFFFFLLFFFYYYSFYFISYFYLFIFVLTYISDSLHLSQSTYLAAAAITKTCLYNSDPLKPHLYIVKLGFTWVYIIFLISAQKHRLWVFVITTSPRRF